MVYKINKDTTVQEFDKILSSLQPAPRNLFRAEEYLGKIKWGEDALEYQKRIRDEWE